MAVIHSDDFTVDVDTFLEDYGDWVRRYVGGTSGQLQIIAAVDNVQNVGNLVAVYAWEGAGSPTGDQKVLLDMVNTSPGDRVFCGPAVRISGTGFTCYETEHSGTTSLDLYRGVNNSFTLLDQVGGVSASGEFGLQAVGTNPVEITGFHDGVETVSASDSSTSRLETGTGGIFSARFSGVTSPTFDNWSVDDLQVGGGTTQAVGLTAEADSAFGVSHSRLRALGLPAGTELSLSLSSGLSLTVGLSSEAAAALGLTHSRRLALGLASSVGLSQEVSFSKRLSLGQTSETDAPQPLTLSRLLVLTQASEGSLSLPVTSASAGAFGLAEEDDLSQPMRREKGYGLIEALDESISFIVTPASGLVLGQAQEAGEAISVTWKRLVQLGLAVEVDTSEFVDAEKMLLMGLSTVAAEALAVAAQSGQALGVALETDEGVLVFPVKVRELTSAEEVDEAHAHLPVGAEINLQPPFELTFIDPDRGLLFIDPDRGLLFIDPERDLTWN